MQTGSTKSSAKRASTWATRPRNSAGCLPGLPRAQPAAVGGQGRRKSSRQCRAARPAGMMADSRRPTKNLFIEYTTNSPWPPATPTAWGIWASKKATLTQVGQPSTRTDWPARTTWLHRVCCKRAAGATPSRTAHFGLTIQSALAASWACMSWTDSLTTTRRTRKIQPRFSTNHFSIPSTNRNWMMNRRLPRRGPSGFRRRPTKSTTTSASSSTTPARPSCTSWRTTSTLRRRPSRSTDPASRTSLKRYSNHQSSQPRSTSAAAVQRVVSAAGASHPRT